MVDFDGPGGRTLDGDRQLPPASLYSRCVTGVGPYDVSCSCYMDTSSGPIKRGIRKESTDRFGDSIAKVMQKLNNQH